MLTNEVIDSFLKCAYKAYLLCHDGQHGKKTEYELLEDELLDVYKAKFYAELQAKYSEQQLLQDVSFDKKPKIAETTYVIQPVFQSKDVTISFDTIEIAPHKEFPKKLSYLPIEIIPREKVSKIEKLLTSL